MKAFRPILLIALPLILLSAKCKEAKTDDFVEKAEVHTINGGVYGSGYTVHYEITFSNKLEDVLSFDSMFFKADSKLAYRRVAKENGWGLKKLEKGSYYLDAYFQGGDRMQASGEIINIDIPTHAKPKEMGENEGIIYGKYGKKRAIVLMPKLTQKESVNLP